MPRTSVNEQLKERINACDAKSGSVVPSAPTYLAMSGPQFPVCEIRGLVTSAFLPAGPFYDCPNTAKFKGFWTVLVYALGGLLNRSVPQFPPL